MGGMFEHPPPVAHGSQRGREASAILSKPELMRLARGAMEEPSPALARRVCDHGKWAGVVPGVPAGVPRVDTINAEVTTVSFDIES